MLLFAVVSVAVDSFLVFPLFIQIFRSVVQSVIGCLATLDWVKTSLAVLCLACYLVSVGNSNMQVPFYWSNLYFKCHLYCYKIVDEKFLLHLLQMFDELHKGSTRFSLKISDGCDLCYNARLLKVITRLRKIMLA